MVVSYCLNLVKISVLIIFSRVIVFLVKNFCFLYSLIYMAYSYKKVYDPYKYTPVFLQSENKCCTCKPGLYAITVSMTKKWHHFRLLLPD